jgi:hypothetical protein
MGTDGCWSEYMVGEAKDFIESLPRLPLRIELDAKMAPRSRFVVYARLSTMRRMDGKIHAAFAPSVDGARIQIFESFVHEQAVRAASVIGLCDKTGDRIARVEHD